MAMETEQLTLDNTEKGYIKGELLRMIFHNADEAFSIALVKILETNEKIDDKEVVIKGHVGHLEVGEHYVFYGEVHNHVKFGRQYQVNHFQKEIPKTKSGLIAYLSSDLFYGIGKKTAEKIIDTLGENAIHHILADRNVLNDVPGLARDKAEHLYATLRENQGFEHVMVSLADYGFGLQMIQKIYETYKEEAVAIIQENPYQLVLDIEGFGFIRADQVAMKNELPLDHPSRIQAACIYIMNEWIQTGHVYAPKEILEQKVIELLNRDNLSIQAEIISQEIIKLGEEEKLVIEEDKVFLPSLYFAEEGFANQLHRILSDEVTNSFTQAELLKIIGELEEEEGLSYGTEQYEAIELALQSKIMILTGGPGTGKTTVIKGILQAYAKINNCSLDPKSYDSTASFPYILAAPTGRAAKRMTESTGLPAVTIHRLLGWNGAEGFERDHEHPLTGKLLIVDEFSMVDTWLANQLFRAIPDEMQVILVGDEDQLPSVGPGQVLSDLLASNVVKAQKLKEVYRQKEGSKIIQLAHEIKNGTCNKDSLTKDDDFSFISCHESQVIDLIKKVYQRAMDKGIDGRDIQILAPMYRTTVGINRLNEEIQQLVNPPSKQRREIKDRDRIFRTGDKVIQLVNQPEEGVYNGDIGEIVAILKEDENEDETEKVIVDFDGKEVGYIKKDISQFMHAYCTSIHKSQGSEFSIVILPVLGSYMRMLRRNLLYTAITRSKQSLIICGSQQAFLQGISKLDTNERMTTLKNRLNHSTEELEVSDDMEIDDTEELSPYDFMENGEN